jgi:UDPglucose--hexose-1-phosphate uridylyltransferase
MPELRKDPIVDRWVIISTERGMRPYDFSETPTRTQHGFCPFCYGNESKTPPEILAFRPIPSTANSSGWTLRVVANKFPALTTEGAISRVGEGMFDKISGNGAHEVIIESPNHETPLEELPVKSVEDTFWAFLQRIKDLKNDPRFRFILIFKNHGEAAGATLEHSHSQLIALPIIPETITEEVAAARRHYQYKERCIFCDLLHQERGDKRRVVSENEQFIALCPYAPRVPFETWILPKYHSARFENDGAAHFPLLAQIMKETLLRINRTLKAPPYNFYLHTSPLLGNYDEYYHWHLEIMPKTTKVAGFEQGTGCYINPTPPEEAAELLRNAKI